MNISKVIAELRSTKDGWSQSDLAANSGVSGMMMGKCEREEAAPSIDAAK